VLQAASDIQGPPPPAKKGARGVEAPIDDNIWILLILGVIFGVYVIYKRYHAINKAS